MGTWDQEWIMYLNGLEAGNFREQEVQDEQVYFSSSRYMDILMDAMDLKAEMLYCTKDIGGLR